MSWLLDSRLGKGIDYIEIKFFKTFSRKHSFFAHQKGTRKPILQENKEETDKTGQIGIIFPTEALPALAITHTLTPDPGNPVENFPIRAILKNHWNHLQRKICKRHQQ